MGKVFRTELRRAFCSKGMLFSLVIGMGIVFWHQYTDVWSRKMEIESFLCIESVYYNWLGASLISMQSYVYYMILPLLAVMPAGLSYREDLRTGYYKNIYLRGKKKEYLWSKYFSVFLSGGVAVTLPLIVSFLLTAMHFPMLKPESIMDMGPNMTSIGYTMYFTHPLLYVGMFMILDFLFAGGFATISLITTFFTEYRFAVSITPFACYYLLYALNQIFSESFVSSPNYFLNSGYENCLAGEFIAGIFIFICIAIFYIWKGEKYE